MYEESVASGAATLQASIEIDTMLQGMSDVLRSSRYSTEETVALYRDVDAQIIKYLEAMVQKPADNFTDFYRLVNNASFFKDKLILPVLFGNNKREARHRREEAIDGIYAKSVEIVEILLTNAYDRIFDTHQSSTELREIRGAIQESTIMALLNREQNGDFVVLPTGTYQDVKQGVDLLAYYIAADGGGYMSPISVKSTRSDAEEEKSKYPEKVILSAAEIDNLDLSVSRLLVREVAGSPGLNDTEEAIIDQAIAQLYDSLAAQLQTKNDTVRLPHRTTQDLRHLAQISA